MNNDNNNDDHKSDESLHENMRYFLFWIIEQQDLIHQNNMPLNHSQFNLGVTQTCIEKSGR